MAPIPIFVNPDRYARPVPVDQIVADRKVYRRGVDRYKKILRKGEDIKAIIVVKHPTREVYAVLDGHHRFWAQKEMGANEVFCAVIQDYYGVTFYLTKHGIWQPTANFTRKIRVPLIKLGNGLVHYLKRFANRGKKAKMNGPKYADDKDREKDKDEDLDWEDQAEE